MNKQDLKIILINNGFNPESSSKKVIISFSLCPKTYSLKKKFKDFNNKLNTWIDQLEVKCYTQNLIQEEPNTSLVIKEYSHNDYKFNSAYISSNNKKKIKTIAAMNGVTVSSMIRLFIRTYCE